MLEAYRPMQPHVFACMVTHSVTCTTDQQGFQTHRSRRSTPLLSSRGRWQWCHRLGGTQLSTFITHTWSCDKHSMSLCGMNCRTLDGDNCHTLHYRGSPMVAMVTNLHWWWCMCKWVWLTSVNEAHDEEEHRHSEHEPKGTNWREEWDTTLVSWKQDVRDNQGIHIEQHRSNHGWAPCCNNAVQVVKLQL